MLEKTVNKVQDQCLANSPSFQGDEFSLIMDSRTAITIIELVDTVRASDEHCDRGKSEEGEEELESPVQVRSRSSSSPDVAPVSPGKDERQDDEPEKAADLERETGQPDVDAVCAHLTLAV